MNKLAGAVVIGDAYNAPIRAGDPGPIISNLISVVFVVAGVYILFMFIFAGLGMIKSAGSGSPEDAAKAKRTLTYTLIGFTVVFTSYWIVRFIEVITGIDFITNPVI